MNGVTSWRRRRRVCSEDSAKERRKERRGGGGRGCGCCLRRLCTDVFMRQIHHPPVRHQSGTPRVMFSAAGTERRRGENGEMRLHRCGHVLREFQIRNAKKKRGGRGLQIQQNRCPYRVNTAVRKSRQMVLHCHFFPQIT